MQSYRHMCFYLCNLEDKPTWKDNLSCEHSVIKSHAERRECTEKRTKGEYSTFKKLGRKTDRVRQNVRVLRFRNQMKKLLGKRC